MNASTPNTDNRLNRIAELKATIRPIEMNKDNLEENIKMFLERSNDKLVQYIRTNVQNIDSNTTFDLTLDERYSRLNITNKESCGSWNHGFELTIELHGFDKWALLGERRKDSSDAKGFDTSKVQYSVNASSCNPNLENIQSLDTAITKAFLCVEMKKYGESNTKGFFGMMNEFYAKYFALLNEQYDIKSEIYPFANEIQTIEAEIKAEEKAVQDGLTLVEISNHIGQRLEFDTEKVEALENAKYRYGSNLRQMFGLDWYASHITILKVSAKTVSIQVGDYTYENKRVRKEDMIKYFPMLKVLVQEEGEQDKIR
jgi:hypothetical protein